MDSRNMYLHNEVPKEVLVGFQLDAKHIEQIKRIYKISTSTGVYALKPVQAKVEKVIFMQNVIRHLRNNGFTNAVPLLPTENGSLMIEHAGVGYILSSWICGRTADFRQQNDLIIAARVMGRLHKAGQGFHVKPGDWSRNVLGLWPIRWQKGLNELQKTESIYLRAKYCEQAEQALDLLYQHNLYPSQVELARQNGNLCHRDLVYHNLLIDQLGMINIIDFDYCALEMPAADIGRFLRMALPHAGWHWSTARAILNTYNEVFPLNRAVLQLIYAYLTFPHNVLRMLKNCKSLKKNYNPQKQTGPLYLDTLKEEEHRQFFLQEMAAEIKFIGR